jgi:hypothetical protein
MEQELARFRPISVRQLRDGSFEHSGLDYANINLEHGNVHITRRTGTWRKKPVPEWALSDRKLCELIVCFFEARVGWRRDQPGTLKERLDRAVRFLQGFAPERNLALDLLCGEYVARKRYAETMPECAERCAALEREIETKDTGLRFSSSPITPGVVLRAVHLYHRMRMDCVEVGRLCGLKPPHVRKLLHSLEQVWQRRLAAKYASKLA